MDKVCAKAEENDIILMYDQYKTTVTAALEIVDKLSEKPDLPCDEKTLIIMGLIGYFSA